MYEWTHQSLTHCLLCWKLKCRKNQNHVGAHSTGSYLLLCNRKRVYPWLPFHDPFVSCSKHRCEMQPFHWKVSLTLSLMKSQNCASFGRGSNYINTIDINEATGSALLQVAALLCHYGCSSLLVRKSLLKYIVLMGQHWKCRDRRQLKNSAVLRNTDLHVAHHINTDASLLFSIYFKKK